MAIRKITKDTRFIQGMFICKSQGSRGQLVTGPVEIVEATSSRTTVEQEGKIKRLNISSLGGYIVDTPAEGDALFNLLYNREREIDTARNRAAAEAEKQVKSTWQPVIDKFFADHSQ